MKPEQLYQEMIRTKLLSHLIEWLYLRFDEETEWCMEVFALIQQTELYQAPSQFYQQKSRKINGEKNA
ncbi:hypothetical protein [Listeria goaensis]|uniref:hypothetical protein n=1 Tax=Listeria goaensis TaxID=1649188 RepID=UPI000B58B65C|nr:hypothetical protein [Listeria goaensis]